MTTSKSDSPNPKLEGGNDVYGINGWFIDHVDCGNGSSRDLLAAVLRLCDAVAKSQNLDPFTMAQPRLARLPIDPQPIPLPLSEANRLIVSCPPTLTTQR